MNAQPPDTPSDQQPDAGERSSGAPSTGTIVVLMLVALAIGLLIGILVFDNSDGDGDESTVAGTAAGEASGDGEAAGELDQQLAATALRAQAEGATVEGSAEFDAQISLVAAELAYLRGVADLDAASREVRAATKGTALERRLRLQTAAAYARDAALGAVANRRVKDAVLRARLVALRGRAEVVSAGISKAATKAKSAARAEVRRLNRALARSQRRLQQQLRRALRAGGKDLDRALLRIERELSRPIAIPQG